MRPSARPAALFWADQPDRRAGTPCASRPSVAASPPPLRFGFHVDPTGTFVPTSARVQRVSLVSWEHSLDDDSPVFTGDPAAPTTLVARWPTDLRGRLLVDDLPSVRVRPWMLTPAMFAHLAALHDTFPLGRHDLLVGDFGRGITARPCPTHLWRDAQNSDSALARQVCVAIQAGLAHHAPVTGALERTHQVRHHALERTKQLVEGDGRVAEVLGLLTKDQSVPRPQGRDGPSSGSASPRPTAPSR